MISNLWLIAEDIDNSLYLYQRAKIYYILCITHLFTYGINFPAGNELILCGFFFNEWKHREKCLYCINP